MISESKACQLKEAVSRSVKEAMRSKDKERLAVLRTLMSEFKRVEVDERIAVDDGRALLIMDKQLKQRRDSAKQYIEAGRQELADIENFEIDVIQAFLPTALNADEISEMLHRAIADTKAQGMRDMGKVMAVIKPQAQGRADMAEVSKVLKSLLV